MPRCCTHLTYFAIVLWISLFSSSFNLWRMDSKREKWKLMYCATWERKNTQQKKAEHYVRGAESGGKMQRQIQGGHSHTSLLISSASFSMRKIRALFLEGPCRSLCSSGISVFFSRLCSANENKNHRIQGSYWRKRKKIIFPFIFFVSFWKT